MTIETIRLWLNSDPDNIYFVLCALPIGFGLALVWGDLVQNIRHDIPEAIRKFFINYE